MPHVPEQRELHNPINKLSNPPAPNFPLFTRPLVTFVFIYILPLRHIPDNMFNPTDTVRIPSD